MTKQLERYTWEDALIEADALGLIQAPSVNFALRISRAINWKPKENKPLGLNWRNETAFKAVGTSRATYFRVKHDLINNGFLIQKNGNLVPTMPDNVDDLHTAYNAFVKELTVSESQTETKKSHIETKKSHIETKKSHIETKKSHIETKKSQSDTPFSEDTFSEDLFSDDSLSEDTLIASGGASGKPSASNSLLEEDKDDPGTSLISEGHNVAGEARNDSSSYLENRSSSSYLENETGGSAICSEEREPESQCETFAVKAARAGIEYSYEAYLKVPRMTPARAYRSALRQKEGYQQRLSETGGR